MNTIEQPVLRQIMTTEVAVLHEEDNLEIAERGIAGWRFRHLPVVEGNKLVGLVTERDLLRASISSLDERHALKDFNLKRYFFVREIMRTDVLTARPDTSLLDAGRAMLERKIGCLPVVEADGTLVGIVTESDFLALALDLLQRPAASMPVPRTGAA
jgi:CBS domain-containing protein